MSISKARPLDAFLTSDDWLDDARRCWLLRCYWAPGASTKVLQSLERSKCEWCRYAVTQREEGAERVAWVDRDQLDLEL